MLELLIVIFLLSPIIAIIAIICAVSSSKKSKSYEEELENLRVEVDLYREKYGNFSDEIIEARKKEILENNLTNVETIETNKVGSVIEIEKQDDLATKIDDESEEIYSTPLTTLIKEYIDKNNISQGNLLFALGVIFISIAGIVFATTTWKIIPNIYKILIILIVALLFRFLSNFAKNKFKLIKASITFYMLFCILTSLIVLSMGYFNMLGSYLTIGGSGQFLLYAISLLVFIVTFAIFTLEYNFYKLASQLLYAVNIEVLLIVLNFTKRFDLLILILSIYNLILMIVSNTIQDKSFIFIKKMREVSNNTLLIISLLSITNANYGILMSIMSLGFATLFLNDYIVFENKKYNSISFKFIIVPLFLILSCIRFNVNIDFRWTSEYLIFLIIVLSILFISFDKYKRDNFLFMIYIMIVAFCISLYKDFLVFDITKKYLITLFINLIQIIILLIKSKEKIFKYIKTFFYIVFTVSLSRYLFLNSNFTTFSATAIISIMLFFGYVFSNLIDKKLFKDKFTDLFIATAYNAIITINLFIATFLLNKNYAIFDRVVLYSILLIISISINYINQLLYSNNKKIKEFSFIHNLFLFLITCYVIKLNPFASLIVLASIIYDYIKNKNRYCEYILIFSYLIYVNLLGYLVLADYRIIILLVSIVLIIFISNFVDYKKIRNLDLQTIHISTVLNLMLISFIEFAIYSNNSNIVIVSILFNILTIYLCLKRNNNYLFSISFLIYNNFLSYFVLDEYRIFILFISICLFFVSNEISKYKNSNNISNRLIDMPVVFNLLMIAALENFYFEIIEYNIVALLFFNALLIYLYFHRDKNYKKIIEVASQFSIFLLSARIFMFFSSNIFSYYALLAMDKFYIGYYIAFMIISICSVFNDNIKGLTKYCMPVALFICISRILRVMLMGYRDFGNDILTIFLLLYLIAVLIKLKIKNIEYKSNYVLLLIISQILTLERTFSYLIRFKLLEFYKYINLQSILKFGTYFNSLFYYIIINFLVFIAVKKLIKCREYKGSIKANTFTYESFLSLVKSNYLLITRVIVVVLTVYLFILMFSTNNYIFINNYPKKVLGLMFIRFVILASIINISLYETRLAKFSKIIIFLIPFAFIKFFISDLHIRYIALLIMFIIHYILSFTQSSKRTKIIYKDFQISYFAIANFVIVPYFNSMIHTFNYFLTYKLLLKSIDITMIDLMFAGIFVLQFKTREKFIDKCIYSLSLFFIMLSLLCQKVFTLINFKTEYYLLIMAIALFILDKVIWKFKNKISNYIWIYFHILAFTIIYSKIITSNLILNTIIFGLIMFIILLISFVIKKYYHFIISFMFMILTAIYITRNFWLSIEWWAYLLIVGILLIIFATKNEQLKNQNKNFIIAIKELNEKLKNKFS